MVDLNYSFEYYWLIELFHRKLPDNNLAGEFIENRSFVNQSQSRKLSFLLVIGKRVSLFVICLGPVV